MKKGWKKVKLGKYCLKIGSGVTPRGGSKVYIEKGIPLFRSQNIYNISFTNNGLVFIDDVIAKKMSNAKVVHGDVLINITGDSVARCCIPPSELLPARVNQHVTIIRSESTKLDSRYLMYSLNSPFMQATLLGIATGSGATRNALTKNTLENLVINLPPLPTQKKIAAILSAYDDLIENNLKRIKLLEEMAQITYEEWFVRMRFPGHETAEWDEKSGLPVGWERKKLGEVCEFNMKKINKGYSGDIIYVDISSVSTNSIEKNNPIPFAKAPGRAKRKLSHGDLIWSCVRPNRKSYAMIWNPESNLIASTGFCVITPKFYHSSFIHNALSSVDFISYLVNNATGAAYPAVKVVDFENYDITIPTLELLNLFGNHFDKSLDTIHKLTLQNQYLKEARDILLPRLMSGLIDVDEVKIPAVGYKMDGDLMGSMAAEGDVGYGG